MERKIIRKLAKKEKKKRAAVNQADGDETVSAEVKKKLRHYAINSHRYSLTYVKMDIFNSWEIFHTDLLVFMTFKKQ